MIITIEHNDISISDDFSETNAMKDRADWLLSDIADIEKLSFEPRTNLFHIVRASAPSIVESFDSPSEDALLTEISENVTELWAWAFPPKTLSETKDELIQASEQSFNVHIFGGFQTSTLEMNAEIGDMLLLEQAILTASLAGDTTITIRDYLNVNSAPITIDAALALVLEVKLNYFACRYKFVNHKDEVLACEDLAALALVKAVVW
jgi:hypothetical protein